MTLGEKIKLIRLAEGLSQEQLANLTGIKKGTLKNIEQGIGDPGWSQIERLFVDETFERYAMWLTINQTNIDAGQVSPDDVKNIRDQKKLAAKQQGLSIDDVFVSVEDINQLTGKSPSSDLFQDYLKEINAVTQKFME